MYDVLKLSHPDVAVRSQASYLASVTLQALRSDVAVSSAVGREGTCTRMALEDTDYPPHFMGVFCVLISL